MVTDPIADFLTRIRNAQMAGHRIVEIPANAGRQSRAVGGSPRPPRFS